MHEGHLHPRERDARRDALIALYRHLTGMDATLTIDTRALCDADLALVELREVATVPPDVAQLPAAVDTTGWTGCYVKRGSPQFEALRNAGWSIDHQSDASPLMLSSPTWPGDLLRMIPGAR